MSNKPSLPKGMRDFGPSQMAKRNYIFNTIKAVFSNYGYMPLETPAMENLSVLTGKYGDEGDKLLYKVLNSGDFMTKVQTVDIENGSRAMTPKIAEKGLKYDLTVPFARYVVTNRHDLTFPFKRYQIQPVWRADRPQKGRYREFYQCDADVVGTDSLLCEAEIILMINDVFDRLAIQDYDIKINHRKILKGLTESIGAADKETDFLVAIDKLDKVGMEDVKKELTARGLSQEAIEKATDVLSIAGTMDTQLDDLENALNVSEAGLEGIREVREIMAILDTFQRDAMHVVFDPTLARGLSYYTGAIFEVKVNNVSIGSVSGGGRYDDLTGVFGMPGISGVGFSFGVDRIYDVMEELTLFPENLTTTTQVLITHFDEESYRYGLGVLNKLRGQNISSELYPDVVKIKKQLTYANKKGIPYVILIGTEEVSSGLLTFKELASGQEEKVELTRIVDKLQGC